MNRKELMELFNKQPRIGTLSTSNRKGDVNVAIFGSPRMIDEDTVIMGIGKNRTLHNLIENPKAVFIIVEPGTSLMDWNGCRVYMEAETIQTEGEFYDEIKKNITKAVGEFAAKMIHAAVRFRVHEVRNLIAPP